MTNETLTTPQTPAAKLPLHVGTGRGHHETIYDKAGDLVAYATGGGHDQDAMYAQLIVRAVNNHQSLVSACEMALMRARDLLDHPEPEIILQDRLGMMAEILESVLADARH